MPKNSLLRIHSKPNRNWQELSVFALIDKKTQFENNPDICWKLERSVVTGWRLKLVCESLLGQKDWQSLSTEAKTILNLDRFVLKKLGTESKLRVKRLALSSYKKEKHYRIYILFCFPSDTSYQNNIFVWKNRQNVIAK